MAKKSDVRKMTVADLVAPIPLPGSSSICGQFIELTDETAIDPAQEIHSINQGEAVELPCGSTICVFSEDRMGRQSQIKLHATQKITLTGPMLWAHIPSIDVREAMLAKFDYLKGVGEFPQAMVLLTGLILAAVYYFVTALLLSLFHIHYVAGEDISLVYILGFAAVLIGVPICCYVAALRSTLLFYHRLHITDSFVIYMNVGHPSSSVD